MSLSISSSERLLDAGEASAERYGRYQQAELRWAKRLCLLSPLAAILAVPIIDHYLLTVIYLQPAESTWQVVESFRSKPAIAAACALAALPFLWLAGIKVDPPLRRSKIPWAVVLAAAALVALAATLSLPRARWFFVEWAKVRTPNPSFARNTLFWEQAEFEATSSPQASGRVGLVGSSQTYHGFDFETLATARPDFIFEKNCLAGFGPMQYPFLQQRIDERDFDTIVCHLSEFDFYREDVVPLERLRWAASLAGTAAIASTLTPKQQWENRASLADLAFASVVPLWRLRGHFRRTVFGYWWNKSRPDVGNHADTERLADAPGLQEAIAFLPQNIGQKELVEANFASFALFVQHQQQRGVKLIVLEGHVHPKAREAYDKDGLQQRTRERLQEMSARYDFQYFSSDQVPRIAAEDFADAYHLNPQGRVKISTFLAEQLGH